MDRYNVGDKIGEGSFGKVYLATKKKSGEKRAIKHISATSDTATTEAKTKRFTWDEMYTMRELQSILRLQPQNHPNIVQLYEVHRDSHGTIRFVFEYMSHGTLLELMDQCRNNNNSTANGGVSQLSNHEIRNLVHQIILGVQHLHRNNIYHRDLKPENILLGPNHICKVADFSLARGCDEVGNPTSYVSTRWYRAPEILLRSSQYKSPVDMWAIGCIVSELYTFEPLFPGRDEFDQLNLIFAALGTPQTVHWTEGMKLLDTLNIQSWQGDLPTHHHVSPHTFMMKALSAHSDIDLTIAVEFLLSLLSLNPARRSDADTALRHTYLTRTNQQVSSTSEIVLHEQRGRKVTPPNVYNKENVGILSQLHYNKQPFFANSNQHGTNISSHQVNNILNDVSNVQKQTLDINTFRPLLTGPYKDNPYKKGRVR